MTNNAFKRILEHALFFPVKTKTLWMVHTCKDNSLSRLYSCYEVRVIWSYYPLHLNLTMQLTCFSQKLRRNLKTFDVEYYLQLRHDMNTNFSLSVC